MQDIAPSGTSENATPYLTYPSTTLTTNWVTLTVARPSATYVTAVDIAQETTTTTTTSATYPSTTAKPGLSPTSLTPGQIGGIFAGIFGALVLLTLVWCCCAGRRTPPGKYWPSSRSPSPEPPDLDIPQPRSPPRPVAPHPRRHPPGGDRYALNQPRNPSGADPQHMGTANPIPLPQGPLHPTGAPAQGLGTAFAQRPALPPGHLNQPPMVVPPIFNPFAEAATGAAHDHLPNDPGPADPPPMVEEMVEIQPPKIMIKTQRPDVLYQRNPDTERAEYYRIRRRPKEERSKRKAKKTPGRPQGVRNRTRRILILQEGAAPSVQESAVRSSGSGSGSTEETSSSEETILEETEEESEESEESD